MVGCMKGAHAAQLSGCTRAEPASSKAPAVSTCNQGRNRAEITLCHYMHHNIPELLLSMASATRSRNTDPAAASDGKGAGPPPWMDSGPLLGIEGIAATAHKLPYTKGAALAHAAIQICKPLHSTRCAACVLLPSQSSPDLAAIMQIVHASIP